MSGIPPKLRKLFAVRDSYGLTNDDLRDIAEVICRRDVPTLKALDDAQLTRMLDALEAASLVLHLWLDRGRIRAVEDSSDDVGAQG